MIEKTVHILQWAHIYVSKATFCRKRRLRPDWKEGGTKVENRGTQFRSKDWFKGLELETSSVDYRVRNVGGAKIAI